jgi:hypothetical protein
MLQQPLSGPGSPLYGGLTIKLGYTTALRRTPLDENELSARRRDLYLKTHISLDKQTSIIPAEFEPAIPASEWPQTHPLEGAATGTIFVS